METLEYIKQSIANYYEDVVVIRAKRVKSNGMLYGKFKYTAFEGNTKSRYFVIINKSVYTYPTESKMITDVNRWR